MSHSVGPRPAGRQWPVWLVGQRPYLPAPSLNPHCPPTKCTPSPLPPRPRLSGDRDLNRGGGGRGSQAKKKVCVRKIDLQFRAPLMHFIFFLRKKSPRFLMWVGGWVGQAEEPSPPPPPRAPVTLSRGLPRPFRHCHRPPGLQVHIEVQFSVRYFLDVLVINDRHAAVQPLSWCALLLSPRENTLGRVDSAQWFAVVFVCAMTAGVILLLWLSTFSIMWTIQRLSHGLLDLSTYNIEDALVQGVGRPGLFTELRNIQRSYGSLLLAMDAFGHYVPQTVVRDVLRGNIEAKLGMTERVMTVAFMVCAPACPAGGGAGHWPANAIWEPPPSALQTLRSWERLCVEPAGAGMGGTPMGSSSTCGRGTTVPISRN